MGNERINALDEMIAQQRTILERLEQSRREAGGRKLVRLYAILDNSGSMHSMQQATIDGFNKFIAEQRANDSTDVEVTTTLFSGREELRELYRNCPITHVRVLTAADYTADGSSTALNDAIVRVLGGFQLENDPAVAHVVFIVTDGVDNCSLATKAGAAQVLDALKRRGNWTVVYTNSHPDSWQEAKTYGITQGSHFNYTATPTGVFNNYAAVSAGLSSFRSTVAMTETLSTESLIDDSTQVK